MQGVFEGEQRSTSIATLQFEIFTEYKLEADDSVFDFIVIGWDVINFSRQS